MIFKNLQDYGCNIGKPGQSHIPFSGGHPAIMTGQHPALRHWGRQIKKALANTAIPF
jgi:hypothetical protein